MVYDLSGKLVADYSGRVRRMKTGDNAMKMAAFLAFDRRICGNAY